MYPGDYCLCVLREPMSKDHRKVMARVALNTLLDPDRYLVDLSEILLLPYGLRMKTRAFLSFCSINSSEYVSKSRTSCTELLKIVEE